MALSNAQAASAESIKALVAASDAAALTSIDKALEAGALLVAAKDAAAHGTWLPFLERACIPERKAQRLMTLARSGLKSDTVSEMGGITAALKVLSRRKLPNAGSCLEIVTRRGERIMSTGAIWPSVEHAGYYYCAVMLHLDTDEGGAHLVYTRRPISGRNVVTGGEIYEPVWTFFETNMGAPVTRWEYEEDGIVGRVLAEFLDLPQQCLDDEKARLDRGILDYDLLGTLDMLASVGVIPEATLPPDELRLSKAA